MASNAKNVIKNLKKKGERVIFLKKNPQKNHELNQK